MRVSTKKHIIRLAGGLTALALIVGIVNANADAPRTVQSPVATLALESTTSTTEPTTTTAPAPTTTAVRVASAAPVAASKAPDTRAQMVFTTLGARYSWGERSNAVKQLQGVLKVTQDGLYGKQTRKAHVAALTYFGMSTANVPSPPVSAAPSSGSSGRRCEQFEGTARAAGWAESEIPRLSYVMWRESKCTVTAYNGKGRDQSYGLVQINTKGANWAELQRRCGLSSKDQLFDPYTNLACGKQLHRAYGWRPWGF